SCALQSLCLAPTYRPVRFTGVGGVSYSAAAASIITDKPTTDGLTYRVESAVSTAPRSTLRDSPGVDPLDPAVRKYLQLPGNVNPVVKQLAEAHTRGAV